MNCLFSHCVDCVWNVMTHAQKPDFVFRRNGRIHLNRRGRQFSRLLAAEVCASAVVTLDTPCSEVVWRVLATHSIRQFPLHSPTRASSCAITFQLESTGDCCLRLMRLEPEADLHPSQTVGRFDRERRQGGGHFFSTCGPRPKFAKLLWVVRENIMLLVTYSHYLASVLKEAIF